MTPAEARILELYRAFNGRDFDGFVAMIAPQVDWANDTDDSRLIGKPALRAYILDQTAQVRAEFAPIHLQPHDDGRISVVAQQVILSTADGSVWSDTRVRHTFTLEDNLVTRMDAERDLGASDQDAAPLLTRFYDAIERCDIDAVMGLLHDDACIPDQLEDGMLSGRDDIRAYFLKLFATINVATSLLLIRKLPDGRVETPIHVVVHGADGGFWWEGPFTMTYRIQDDLILEMAVAKPFGT